MPQSLEQENATLKRQLSEAAYLLSIAEFLPTDEARRCNVLLKELGLQKKHQKWHFNKKK